MEPQVPALNTVCGTLEQNNFPLTEIKPMPGIPPSFASYLSRWEYMTQFPVTVNELNTELFRFKPMLLNNTDSGFLPPFLLPFRTAKFWNGSIDIKLWAVIPERYGGKFQIIYLPNHMDSSVPGKLDSQQRYILKEWDLSATDTCEFSVKGFNTILQRPTYYNETPSVKRGKPTDLNYIDYPDVKTEARTYDFGTIIIKLIQELQPGSVFPETIDVVVYKSYPDSSFQTITDFRNETTHSIPI